MVLPFKAPFRAWRRSGFVGGLVVLLQGATDVISVRHAITSGRTAGLISQSRPCLLCVSILAVRMSLSILARSSAKCSSPTAEVQWMRAPDRQRCRPKFGRSLGSRARPCSAPQARPQIGSLGSRPDLGASPPGVARARLVPGRGFNDVALTSTTLRGTAHPPLWGSGGLARTGVRKESAPSRPCTALRAPGAHPDDALPPEADAPTRRRCRQADAGGGNGGLGGGGPLAGKAGPSSSRGDSGWRWRRSACFPISGVVPELLYSPTQSVSPGELTHINAHAGHQTKPRGEAPRRAPPHPRPPLLSRGPGMRAVPSACAMPFTIADAWAPCGRGRNRGAGPRPRLRQQRCACFCCGPGLALSGGSSSAGLRRAGP